MSEAMRRIALAVDGGIAAGTAADTMSAGANVLVAGTSVFHAKDYARAIAALREDGRSAGS